jgi:hypothetical protein
MAGNPYTGANCYPTGSSRLLKNNTIHEPTRNQHEADVQFGLFRVISWIVPLVFADAQQFLSSLLARIIHEEA